MTSRKVRVTFTIDVDEAKKLKKFSGYASPLISYLLKEFFLKIGVEEIWKAMEMEKPVEEKERLKKLKKFIERIFNGFFVAEQKENELTEINKNTGKLRNSLWGLCGKVEE